jgi:hypothetical protein
VYVVGEPIGMAATGKARALRALDGMQGSSLPDAVGEAEGEACAQSAAAAGGALPPRKIPRTRAAGSRDPARQAMVEAKRDLPPRSGL